MMQLNGDLVFECDLHVPPTGAWSAMIKHSATSAVEAQVIIDFASKTWLGTEIEYADSDGFRSGIVVGGYDTLQKYLQPAHHVGVPLQSVLQAHANLESFGPIPTTPTNIWIPANWTLQNLLDTLTPGWWMSETGVIQTIPRTPQYWSITPDQILQRDARDHTISLVEEMSTVRPGDLIQGLGEVLEVSHVHFEQTSTVLRVNCEVK